MAGRSRFGVAGGQRESNRVGIDGESTRAKQKTAATFSNSRTLPGHESPGARPGRRKRTAGASMPKSRHICEENAAPKPGCPRAFAQGRKLEADHIEAMEQVFAELPFANHRFQIAMGGGDYANIHGMASAPPTRWKLLLEHAQEFTCVVGADRRFRRGKGCPCWPARSGQCAAGPRREGAAFVTEQFALEQVLRDAAQLIAMERLLWRGGWCW